MMENSDYQISQNCRPMLVLSENGQEEVVDLWNNPCMGEKNGIHYSVEKEETAGFSVFKLCIANTRAEAFTPDHLDFILGINTYMADYPARNHVFFPTMLRCEKTHFHGYFMRPDGKCLAVASPQPMASYSLLYSKTESPDEFEGEYGHRIHTAALSLLHKGPLPARHPQDLNTLAPGEQKAWDIYFIPFDGLSQYAETVSSVCGLPVITSDKYLYAPNEKLTFAVQSNEAYEIHCYSPTGAVLTELKTATPGVYTVKVTTGSEKISEAKFYCRRPWMWYLEQARKEAFCKPQKATTHAESWYGFYSAFLAAKHRPNKALDQALAEQFAEISALMFDFDAVEPLVIPERIQNTSTLIGVLVDLYESDPQNNRKALQTASQFGDWLLRRQKADGGYYKNDTLYTCVIYIAKSMLELAAAEKAAGMDEAANRHYQSAAKACESLCQRLDNIQTEGEQTFEDGMIACSALQLGMYALTLPPEARKPYIDAAVYMDEIHACLEQKLVPDCRMNGGSLRFWEAQYDIMFHKNFINSPHGWSAWTAYAKYYLYLLTGREKYLSALFNCLGACVQLMDDSGNLRWAFANDPYICGRKLVADETRPVADGYASVSLQTPAYRGTYREAVHGEEYLDMVSGWYRMGGQRLTGGYGTCPLIWPDRLETVDTQGGACDNDVHEIFKCLEETVLKKAFVLERENGELAAYNCTAEDVDGVITVHFFEETDVLHTNFITDRIVRINGAEMQVPKGFGFIAQ